jgi:multiple sugar transport system permease protein
VSSLSLSRTSARRRRAVRKKKVLGQLAIYVAVIFVLIVMLAPIIWLGITSIRPLIEISTVRLNLIPKNPSFRNYHAMARYNYVGGKLLFVLVIFFRMIPPIAAIVPLFMLFERFHLLGTFTGLIVAHTAFKLPLTIWLLRNFFVDVPRELDDAARVDGASTLRVLVQIALPLIQPGLAATAVLAFLWTWNDLLLTLVLSTSKETEMLPLGLTKFVLEYGVDWGSMTAAGMIMFIPTLLFVFIAQRYLIRGLTAGAVKD